MELSSELALSRFLKPDVLILQQNGSDSAEEMARTVRKSIDGLLGERTVLPTEEVAGSSGNRSLADSVLSRDTRLSPIALILASLPALADYEALLGQLAGLGAACERRLSPTELGEMMYGKNGMCRKCIWMRSGVTLSYRSKTNNTFFNSSHT